MGGRPETPDRQVGRQGHYELPAGRRGEGSCAIPSSLSSMALCSISSSGVSPALQSICVAPSRTLLPGPSRQAGGGSINLNLHGLLSDSLPGAQ